MDFYIDIKLKPDAEMRENVLMNKVFTKLHKALCDIDSNNVGVSFPAYKVLLGDQLRIHASSDQLTELQSLNWIGGLIGYCHVSQILNIPTNCQYRTVSRKQSNMSQSKLSRLLRRGSIESDEVKQYKAKMYSKGLDNPYLELVSGSTGHKHRRYIEFGELKSEPEVGLFDQFGLSKTATVPWF